MAISLNKPIGTIKESKLAESTGMLGGSLGPSLIDAENP